MSIVNSLTICVLTPSFAVKFRDQIFEGTDAITQLHNCIKNVLNGYVPDVIYVLTGPGSFTSVRMSIITTKTLSIAWNKPIKACSLFECVKGKWIVPTGTDKWLVRDKGFDALLNLDQIDLNEPFYSYDSSLYHYSGFVQSPNIINSMEMYLVDQNFVEIDQLEPLYPIKPAYI